MGQYILTAAWIGAKRSSLKYIYFLKYNYHYNRIGAGVGCVCMWGGGGRVMFSDKILIFKGPEIYIQELLTIILVKNAGCIGRKFALVVNFLNGIHYLANWPKIASIKTWFTIRRHKSSSSFHIPSVKELEFRFATKIGQSRLKLN